MRNPTQITATGLYHPCFERDSCGFGLIAHLRGQSSPGLVRTAIESLACLTHRGAVAADGQSGDGCGLLLGRAEGLWRALAAEAGIDPAATFGTGLVFLDPDPARAGHARATLERQLRARGLKPAGWRPVPVDPAACGPKARTTLPRIEQVYVDAPAGMDAAGLERELYMARRLAEKSLADDPVFYLPSLSCRVLCYKALVIPGRLTEFYPDLLHPRMESHLCVFHQRFSTNTLPQWRLAQPFRLLAHNGEINTIQGNRNWSEARAANFRSPALPDLDRILPLVRRAGSDSESLDNMLEALLMGGMDLLRAVRILIPPAWQNVETMDPDLRAFYEVHSMHMEPWDGPAGLVMTDGRHAACTLDRNGLRPARWVLTRDQHITLASEIGVYGYSSRQVLRKGRLGPGQMVAVDTRAGRLLLSADIDAVNRRRRPYGRWLGKGRVRLYSAPEKETPTDYLPPSADPAFYAKLFLLSLEERDQVLRVLADKGREAVGSMGDDTPLPVLSRRPRSLYDYFRQQFAQVTNPPIDPLREQLVMSLETCFGPERNVHEQTPEHARRLVVDSPVLSTSKLRQLCANPQGLKASVLPLFQPPGLGLREAIQGLCDQAIAAVRAGTTLLVLSDRDAAGRLPVHALLATGAIHHGLMLAGLRCSANLIVDTATARDPHHFAALVGYGATAVHPYLAYAAVAAMQQAGDVQARSTDRALRSYRAGINKGLYKILSKMGISTITSYRGAQLFEAVGLAKEVVDLCFRGTPCRIQGTSFAELEADQRRLLGEAMDPSRPLPVGGLLRYVYAGEYHAYNPDVVTTLQRAVRSGDYGDYRHYARLVNQRPVTALRDLWALRGDLRPIPLEQVESADAILPRFDTAAMSLGALSPEAHEALAIAMNRLGGRSNSGEGGEDPNRYGSERRSKIKQVASGRFGVTPAYLVNAEVLQIKVAQGAKPGEGGQLPGDKVTPLIARLRHSMPGVTLISPPPHHDIYSIEDLAQLIFDLKQVNPQALVSVKLVAEAGVGTIAAGVAKAYADFITIAGHDGGTGASPLSSVKYAGSPWELGLAETQQVLCANGLRERVRLQTDGGLKTGLDVVKAAILGAESFGFGTGPMVALGCKYLRICHLNNCATGIATQHEVLRREHYRGLPEMVMNYFRFIAREVREHMAALGVARFTDLIGRTDLLRRLPGDTAKQRGLDLDVVLAGARERGRGARYCRKERNTPYDQGKLAERMVHDCLPAIEGRTGGEYRYTVSNTQRAIGARLSGEIARRWGDGGMAKAPLVLRLEGTAGQSFGVWNAGGLHLYLEGDANDYVGKGMAGGKLVLYPPKGSAFTSQETPIMGNTCLYGATGGKLYAAGLAGERFAVRNSGAIAVVEGVGDHGCEYMTGGVVAVLGPVGQNFGAGMTGGFAYVLDLESDFPHRYNRELVDVHSLSTETTEAHQNHLAGLIRDFVNETGSARGRHLIDDFEQMRGKFWLVKPKAAELEGLLETLLRSNE